MKGFFIVKTPSEIYQLMDNFPSLDTEVVEIKETLHRIVAEDILSPINLPDFNRSTVDGYALKAKDTFGAQACLPAILEVVGEVNMGMPADIKLDDGQAVRIPTGGMLPLGADAVVMVEHTHEVDSYTIEVSKALAPLENVIQIGDDIKKEELLVHSGHKMRPQDVGIMAAIGKKEIKVFKRPKVAIISTGDEIVDIDSEPPLGKIRDVNSYTLGALVEEAGAEPLYLGIARDIFEDLRNKCSMGLKEADMVIISGGSSVGVRDLALDVITSFPDSKVLAHGISVSPGKPTILAQIGKKALWG
ncbi:MAG TPA: molybdopterin molybdotransferase MoeA, partial [Syntrophaceae bacterium]|nr:molybdopterin molybdotransferase MoeA [Syntrophaceae bacterium]